MPSNEDVIPSVSLYWLLPSAKKLPWCWHRGRVAGRSWRDLATSSSQARLARLSPSPINACLAKPPQPSQMVCHSVQLPRPLDTHPDTSPRPPMLLFKARDFSPAPHRHEESLTATPQQLLLALKIVIMASLGPLSSAFSLRVEFGNNTSVPDIQ